VGAGGDRDGYSWPKVRGWAAALEEPLIRGHAARALGRIGTGGALEALRERAKVENDAWVREELSLALST